MDSMKDIHLNFILVIKNGKDVTWLAGPLAGLRSRLRPFRKIRGIEVAVPDDELALEYNLVC